MTQRPPKHNGLIVREWLALTLLAGVTATTVEAYLLDRKIGLFSGGFLADRHLDGSAERIGFIGASLLSDASVLGVIVAFVLWVCATLQLRPAGRVLYTLGLALVPVFWFDFVSYQIHQYIGDIFNLGVLFDLSGRSIPEFLAVAGPQIGIVLGMLVAGVLGIFGVAWVINRVVPLTEGDAEARWSRGRLVARLALLLLATGLVGTTVMRLGSELVDRGLGRKATGTLVGQVVQFTTDFDRDGYGLLSRPADPAPFNAAIHPYAIDIPGNGIDENGVGGDLPLEYSRYEEGPAVPPVFTRRPPVILVILETFRADLLFRELGGREVTPFLNAMARSGSYTDRAYSHNGWTQQSRYHIFTGSLAGPRGRTTLIDDFNANGYDTAFFSAQDESDDAHLDVGFRRATVSYDAQQDADKRYSASRSPGSIAIPHDLLEERVGEYLATRDADRPLFLHLNFQETHFPYGYAGLAPLVSDVYLTRSQITPSRRDELRAMYDNAAANVDAAMGRMVALVRAHTGQEPLVVAIADHGESLFEDGLLGHGTSLSDSQTRIPLAISEPGVPIPLPFGQAELRDLVQGVLTADLDNPKRSQGYLDGRKTVLQYMGDMRRARQLALITEDGRLTFDLHDGEVTGTAAGSAGRTDSAVIRMIHLWEALLLAGAPGSRY